MRLVRQEMRNHAAPRLTVPQLRALLYLKRHPDASLSAVAEHLGISVGLLPTAADFQQAMQRVCSAVAAGEIGIGEAGRIARQVRTQMRGLRRLARIQRHLLRLAQKTDPARPPLG